MVIEGVLLDVNETLFPLEGIAPAFAQLGLSACEVELWATCVLRDGLALAAAGHYRSFADVAQGALIGLAPSHLHDRHAQAVLRALQTLDPYPDVADGLRQLWVAGVKIVTLTTTDRELCEALFRRTGLAGYVDRFLSTDAVRCWKPAHAAYQYGLDQLGLPAHRVAVVTAHAWDIHGAAQAGLRTAWVARPGVQSNTIYGAPDIVGATLPEVAQGLLAYNLAEAR